jgi:hypothetical protein
VPWLRDAVVEGRMIIRPDSGGSPEFIAALKAKCEELGFGFIDGEARAPEQPVVRDVSRFAFKVEIPRDQLQAFKASVPDRVDIDGMVLVYENGELTEEGRRLLCGIK